MNILIVGLNYAPEEIGIGPYTTGLAERFALAGHSVEVIAGKPYYPEWRARPGRRGTSVSTENGVRVHRCPHYIPVTPSGGRRILHYLSFAASALPTALRSVHRRAPDVVLAIAPALLSAPVALLAGKRGRARTWLHVQDFEVDAAVATGLLGRGAAARLAERYERAILARFDRVSTISPAMASKAQEKGVAANRISEIRNWAEIATIGPGIDGAGLRGELGLPPGRIVLYAGNLALKQGIATIAEAAARLRHRSDIVFVVCGEGSGRTAFAEAIRGSPNVHLRPLQPRARLGELLALADVHLLPQIAGAADLVLPSKLANMLASGRPVVATALPGTSLFKEVEGCGLVTPPGDPGAFAAAIETLVDDHQQAVRLGEAGRARALERWSRDAILDRFVAEVTASAAG